MHIYILIKILITFIILFTQSIHIKLVAILLVVAFFAQTFSKGLIVANYFTNTQAYAKNCINKAKPKMHCNGKCQMMRKLKQEENKDSQNPDRKNEIKIDLLFLTQSKQTLSIILGFCNKSFPHLQHKLTKDIAADFFHPPTTV